MSVNVLKDALEALQAYADESTQEDLREVVRAVVDAAGRKDLPLWLRVVTPRNAEGKPMPHYRRACVSCTVQPSDTVDVSMYEGMLQLSLYSVINLDKPRAEMLRDLCSAYIDGNFAAFLDSVEGGVW
jgi:hypothetical protein